MNNTNRNIMDFITAERVKKSFLLFFAFLLSLSIFAQPVPGGKPIPPDPFEHAKLSSSCDVMSACPGEPVAFELENVVDNKDFVYMYEWSKSKNGVIWEDNRKLTVPSKTYMMWENDLSVKLVAHASFEGTEVYSHEFDFTVNQRRDCKIKSCHLTTTGEYYGGTDFNLEYGATSVDWSTIPPRGLEEYFSEQNIEFQGIVPGKIMNQEQLGVPLHIDDSLKVNPNNNFYVYDAPNDQFFAIRFPRWRFEQNRYRFTMRFYMIIPANKSCEMNSTMRMIARTGHGITTQDLMDIKIYDDQTNKKFFDRKIQASTSVVTECVFGDAIAAQYRAGVLNVFRFEMVYYGYLPSNTIAYYEFFPEFGQFPECSRVAIDYISAEAEGACLDPSIACIDSISVVHASGFASEADYKWTKYSDCNYTNVVPWQPGEVEYVLDEYNHKEQAHIKLLDKGVFYYTLSDNNTSIQFSLGGQVCGSAFGPGIDGDPNVCIPSFPHRQHYELKDISVLDWIHENGDEYGFKWWLESPNHEDTSKTLVFLDPAADNKSVDLVVLSERSKLSSSYNPDAPYKLYVTSHIVDPTTKELSSVFESKDSVYLWLYDQPDISRLNFVTKRGEDTICVAKSSDTIILQHKEDVMGYTWNFTGATMVDSVIHIDGYDKTALCNSVDATFPVSLEVVNGVCRATLNDEFTIHSTDEPTIDCSNLSEPSTYYLQKGQLDTTVFLPIPKYETSCDDDPDLNVNIHYVASDSIHNFDSTYTLHRAQLEDKSKTALTLFAGKGDVTFSVVDGCGKSATCSYTLSIVDTISPVVDCDLVDDYTVKVTTDDGCVAKPGKNINITIPRLQDLTFTDTTIYITGEYAGRSAKDLPADPMVDLTKYSMEKGLNDDYEVGTTFILWRFSDPSGNAMYCRSRVSVENGELMFDCDSVTTIRTNVNRNPNRVYAYASAQAQSTVNPDTKYSLEGVLTIPQANSKYCANTKLTIRFTGICVNDEGDTVAYATDSVITPEELLKHRFPIGLTTVTYQFTSDYLDFDLQRYDTVTCSQDVIVSSNPWPIPFDCPHDAKLYVDPDNCLAPSPYNSYDKIPRAKVSFFCETKYTYDACSGTPYDYDNLGLSSALSKDYDTIIYPSSVRRILFLDSTYSKTDSTVVLECISVFTSADSVPVKKVQHRNGEFNTVCAEDSIEKMALKVNNFTEIPSCVIDSIPRGHHVLIWYFDNGKGDYDSCLTHLDVVDSTAPDLKDVCKEPEKDVFAKDSCEVPYSALDLPELVVHDFCDGDLYPEIIAYVKQKDSSVIVYHNDELKTATYPTETHKIVWLFTDKAGNQDSCFMFINVVDSVALQMEFCDTNSHVDVTIDPGLCSLNADSLSKYMKFPTAYDMCDDDTIIPRIERRFNGELVTDASGKPIVWNSQDFPLGTTNIRWIFVDQKGLMKDSCEKSVTVKTKLFDCKTLKDTVRVNLLDSFFATPEEVKLAGLVRPQIIIDNCNAAELFFERSDKLDSTENYQIGMITATWKFRYVFGDSVECPQIIDIVDMVPPELKCPDIDTAIHYECYGEIPAPYASFEEFIAAGGSISDMAKYKQGTFRYEETERGEAPCDYSLVRTYYVTDVRNHDESCSQEFTIRDVTPPTIHTVLDTIKIACDQDSLINRALVMDDIIINVSDNCSRTDEIKITTSYQTNRSENVHDCEYNNYTIWRTWVAKDKCGNESAPLTQVVLIVDSVAPKFELPNNWFDTVMATNLKKCLMSVPSITYLFPEYVKDACTEKEDITFWQVPEPGVIITEDTDIWVYSADKCGNRDSVKMTARVMIPDSVVSLTTYDKSICISTDSSNINLWSNEIRFAKGDIQLETYNRTGIRHIPGTYVYDCYRDNISVSNLVYSDNRFTYYDRFAASNQHLTDSIRATKTLLNRHSQSGTYIFVVMDTTTRCSDTAYAYFSINEKPRINLNSLAMPLCADDSLNLHDIDSVTNVCVDPMGAHITKTGWIVDTVDYVRNSPVPYSEDEVPVYYFAENECGRTVSNNSLYATCNDTLYSVEDSLAVAGSVENLQAWRDYKVFRKDSVLLFMHERFNPDSLILSTSPQGLTRCFVGDEMTLAVNTHHYVPVFYSWYKVIDSFDGDTIGFDREGKLLKELDEEFLDSLMYRDYEELHTSYSFYPLDSAFYYVLVGDGVCPAVPSNLYKIDVLTHVPTAFTPYQKDGFNDVFLAKREVVIFDRYGQKVFEGSNGWDGTDYNGKLVDPGVFFYKAIINGNTFKGTIEVVYLRK